MWRPWSCSGSTASPWPTGSAAVPLRGPLPPVVRYPTDHERSVLLLEGQRVGEGGHLARVAAQDLDARTHPRGGIAFVEEIVGRRRVRVRPARELVQVDANAGNLPVAPALDAGRRRDSDPRHRVPQRSDSATLRPGAALAAVSAGVRRRGAASPRQSRCTHTE